jgi:hypothetical protein
VGLLGGIKKYSLNYHGKGCGGSCLPFDTLVEAVAYARSRYALTFCIEDGTTGKSVLLGQRPDCRHSFKTVEVTT